MNRRPPTSRSAPAARRPARASQGRAGSGGTAQRRGRATPSASAARRPATTGGSDRFVARSRRRILRRLVTGLALLLAAGAVGGVVWLVGWSDVTALDDVRVDGVDGELAEAVTATADPPYGTPLIRVDTDAMEEAVTGLPDIAEVSVRRSWPAAVTVAVTPRVPAAAIDAGESWWLVDDTGVLFGERTEQPDGLPVLDAPLDTEAAPARTAGVAVLAGMPGELHDLVVAVAAPTEASVELTLDGGATVMWGTADQLDRKSEVLLALLPEDGSHYDVSAPGNPAVRH